MARIIFLFLMLGACRDDRPAAPSAEQSDQLNQAEDMLNGMETNGAAQNENGPK